VIPEALLPPGLSEAAALGLIATAFGTSGFTAAFGIGGGVILLALLATLIPPAALIPVHGLVQFGSNVGRASILLPRVIRAAIPPFLAGSLLGAVAGGAVAVRLPPAGVQIGVGLFILWSVFFTPPAIFRRFGALTGAVSTVLTMFFGATGPFVAAYVKTLTTDREVHVATHAAMMTAQHLLKTLAFGVLGFAFGPWLPLTLAMIAAGFLGTLAGRQVLARLGDRRFYRALDAILILLALRLIWQGGRTLLG